MIPWGLQDEADTGPHSSDVSESVVRVLRPRSGERDRQDVWGDVVEDREVSATA